MYELRVLTGLHRGAALPLIGNKWLIGADKAADLTLKDQGVRPSHCLLIQKNGQFHLRGKLGTITNGEGHQLPVIENIAPGEPFALGGTWLSLDEASAPWPQIPHELLANSPPPSKRILTPTFWGISFAAAIATTGALASLEANPRPAPASPPVALESPKKDTRLTLDNNREVKLMLMNMLKERELGTLVEVREEARTVYLSGEVSQEQLLVIGRMLNRLHLNFDVQIPIENRVIKKVYKLPFEIVQIISGRLAHVVTDDGRRLFVGDELKGMRLVAIEQNRITFDGEQRVEVKW